MTVSASAGTQLAEVLTAVDKSTADVVVLRYPAREVHWFAALATGARTALLADSLIYWSLPVGKGRRPAPLAGFNAGLEPEIDDDLVDDLVGDIFGDYGNHYCANPLFDRALALAGYQEWARRSIADEGAVVLRGPDRRVLALATVDQAGVLDRDRAGGRRTGRARAWAVRAPARCGRGRGLLTPAGDLDARAQHGGPKGVGALRFRAGSHPVDSPSRNARITTENRSARRAAGRQDDYARC